MKKILQTIWDSITGRGFLPHARCCGAITIVGVPALQYGVELAEVGVQIRRFIVRYFPEINAKLGNHQNETVVRGISNAQSRDVTAEGEVSGGTGIMAFTLAAAVSFANDVNNFGASAGMLLMDEATVTQERSGWRSVNVRASSNPQLV